MEKPLKVLIDTGSNKNYIHPKFTMKSHKIDKLFKVSSFGGDMHITKYSQGKSFKPYSDKIIECYHMEELKSFNAVI